jgi:hypothetical protein
MERKRLGRISAHAGITVQLVAERLTSDANSTVGALLVDERFACMTCEDEYRAEKVVHETRIPGDGRRYRIVLRTEGGMHEQYLKRFGPEFHKGMLWLQDVPGFEYVYIHIGNDARDTDGCILVGLTALMNPDGGGSVASSVLAYQRLYPRVRDAILRGDEVWITIVDRDVYARAA